MIRRSEREEYTADIVKDTEELSNQFYCGQEDKGDKGEG